MPDQNVGTPDEADGPGTHGDSANAAGAEGTEPPPITVLPTAGTDTADSVAERDLSGVLRVAGSVAGQTTLLAALLYYFGWARTQALMSYFGISSAIARLSASDYVLRSLDVIVRLLVILGSIALALYAAHRQLAAALTARRHPRLTRLAKPACVTAGLLLTGAGFVGFLNLIVYSARYPAVPVMLASGITLLGYGLRIADPAKPGAPPGRAHRVITSLIVLLDIAFTFWAAAVYASIDGQQAASALAANLTAQPSVTIYSTTALGLTAPGVTTRQLSGTSNQYHYSYTGLKLLLYSDGQYFLIPARWHKGHEPVFLIKDNDDIRIELYPGSP